MKSPRPFQQEAVRASTFTNLLLADECGLGKTLSAIEVAKMRVVKTPEPKILVVCPKALRYHWAQEIQDQDPEGFLMPSHILMVNYIPYNFQMMEYKWYIITYEELSRVHTLYSIVWDFVIFDEAHRLKNPKTRRSLFARRLLTTGCIALSGTPMERTPADLWAIFDSLKTPHLPPYWSFVKKYVNLIPTYHGHMRPGGLKDPEAFHRDYGKYILRRTKEQVAPQLPPKIEIDEPVEMSPAQDELYTKVKRSKDIEVDIGEGLTPLIISNVLAQITRLLQISVYPQMFDPLIESAKFEWLDEHLEDGTDQVVVFTRFRNVAEAIAKKHGALLYIGGHNDPPVHFQQGYVRVLVGTIDAMGEGLNLQNAGEAIFMDCHWSATKMTQAIDRIHRMDIVAPKFIYYLHASPVDRLVYRAVQEKWTERQLVLQYMGIDHEVIGE